MKCPSCGDAIECGTCVSLRTLWQTSHQVVRDMEAKLHEAAAILTDSDVRLERRQAQVIRFLRDEGILPDLSLKWADYSAFMNHLLYERFDRRGVAPPG